MNEVISDIFISYSSKDRDWVSKLAAALVSCGYSVWWDKQLLPGQNFHQDIQDALDKARCVITVWSQNSIESRWVQGESSQAVERNIMVPVLYQPVRVPAGFHSLHCADLKNWNGDTEDTNFRQLQQAIDKLLHTPVKHKNKLAPSKHLFENLQGNKRGCLISMTIVIGITLFAPALFILYKSNSSLEEDKYQQYSSGNNSPITNINAKGDNSQVNLQFGDMSITAKKMFDEGLSSIKKELIENFTQAFGLINIIETNQPIKFYDIRRANETEAAYQDRAATAFRDYIKSISDQIKIAKLSHGAFDANRANISRYKADTANRASDTYNYQTEVFDSLLRLESGLQHILSLSLNDEERTAKSLSLYKEKLIQAKINIMTALANFSVIANESDMDIINSILPELIEGKKINLSHGNDGFQKSMAVAAELSKEKTKVLQQNITETAKKRELDRRINDPYLVMMREKVGLPPTLTDAEWASLTNKKINVNEKAADKLMELAGFSFLESDGHASISYLKKALDDSTINEKQKKFIELSIDRLENPDKYDGGLGMLVLDVYENGEFSKAKIQPGDILIKIDNQLINEPYDIASAMVKTKGSTIIFTVIRGDQKELIKVKTDESSGAFVTSLVILNGIKL